MTRRELEDLDAACCALDDARPRGPVITSMAWGLTLARHRQRPQSVTTGETPALPNLTGSARSSAGSPKPHLLGEVGPVALCADTPVKPQGRTQNTGCAPGRGAQYIPTHTYSAPSRGLIAPGTLCVWCIVERTIQGHGPAPRINGDVRLEPCARHSSPAATSPPVLQVGRALDSAAGLPDFNSGGVESRHAMTSSSLSNPYPKGRWTS